VVRARSPFFWITFAFLVVLGASLYGLATTAKDPSLLRESWVKDAAVFGTVRLLSWTFLTASCLVLMGIVIAEIRIHNGWEPESLRQMYRGAEVLAIYQSMKDQPGYKRIEVRLENGRQEWFLLDPDEVNLCLPGDTVHLSAIGKHVANIVIASKRVVIPSPDAAFRSVGEEYGEPLERVFMWLAPMVGGVLMAKGLEIVVFKESVLTGENNVSFQLVGTEAIWTGCLLLGAGAIVATALAQAWRRGWKDTNFDKD
jgi:hypothetical protein